MAPAVGALVGAGFMELWRLRARTRWAGVVLGAAIIGSAAWAALVLARTPDFAPGLGLAIVSVAVLAGVALALPDRDSRGRGAVLAAGLGLAVLIAAPAAYAIHTMSTAHSGGDAAAGPASADVRGGFGGPGGSPPAGQTGQPSFGGMGAAGTPPVGMSGTRPGAGGAGGGGTVDAALTAYLAANRGSATWIVAVSGSEQAGSIELVTGLPVMAIGGFNGGDPAPTLDQLKADVASGRLRYVLVGGGGGGPNGDSSTISDWVTAKGTVVAEVGGGSLYDLSALASGS